MLVNFMLFCLASIGLTNLIVVSNLFEPIRNFVEKHCHEKLYELITCYQCCGTWVGFFTGWALVTQNIIGIFLCGCAGSYLASINYLATEYLLSKTEFIIDDTTT